MSHYQLSEPSEERLLSLLDAYYPTHESVARLRAEGDAEPSTPSTETAPARPTVDWSDITATRLITANDPDNPHLVGLSTSKHAWIRLPAGVTVPDHLLNEDATDTAVAPRPAGPHSPSMSDEALTAEMDRVFGRP